MDANLQKRPSHKRLRIGVEFACELRRIDATSFRAETVLDVYQAKVGESSWRDRQTL